MRILLCCFLFVPFFLGACKKNKCEYKDDGVVAPATEQQAVKHYLDSIGITAQLHSRGFYYKIDTMGTGAVPGECSQIDVAYTGKLTNGQIFDSQPGFSTQLANLIDGWQQGVPLIKQGGDIWLYIPPSLGYGGQTFNTNYNNSPVTVPANSILIFDIHLLDVQ